MTGVSSLPFTSYASLVTDNHMQAARAVGANLNGLLDVGGTRGAGDKVHRARQRPDFITQFLPYMFDLTGNLLPAQHHYMHIRQKVERCRALRIGKQDQRARLGNSGNDCEFKY